jgi:pyruvate dehydrogenase E2 component (dihydrolipoamide acetyltransferase)
MSQSVNLPALGESVTEGTVTRWLKNVGDHVEVDEPLVEVSTDKVDTEIPSPIAGVIEEILVQEDETVEVGTALVNIGDGSSAGGDAPAAPAEEAPAAAEAAPAEAAPAQEAPAAEAEPAQEAPSTESTAQDAPAEAPAQEAPAQEAPAQEAPAQAAPSEQAQAETPSESEAPAQEQAPEAGYGSPAPAAEAPAPAAEAPAQAEQQDYLPSSVPSGVPSNDAPAPATEAEAPSEPATVANAGYVTPLVRKLANERGIDLSTVSGTGVGGRIRKEDLSPAAPTETSAAKAPAPTAEVSELRGTTVPMSRLRKIIAERAVASMQASAQLTSVVEVDVTRVANFRDKVKAEFLEKTGNKLSFLPFFALAAAEALKSYPIINATIDGDNIVYPAQENMSIAVDTERGLLTPVISDAGSLDLAGLAGQIADLATRTRDNKLTPDELSGGTFTLTNTGSRGALFDTPVVFLPQSAILGTGIVTKRPVVVTNDGSDSIAIRSMVYLALSYDHRIVDGADASRFLVQMKTRLEEGDFAANLGL